MPDIELVGLILLLAVAVVFGYFYFKRAQNRSATQVVTRDDASVSAPAEPVAPVMTERTITSEEVRTEERPPS